jgi:hypothetical protein
VASMEKIIGQMKVNKEQVQKQVQQLRQRIDQLINEITVGFSMSVLPYKMLFRIHL